MFASPLVKSDQYEKWDEIQGVKEFEKVEKALEKECKNQEDFSVNLELCHGTKNNLFSALLKNPNILHLSMHGT